VRQLTLSMRPSGVRIPRATLRKIGMKDAIYLIEEPVRLEPTPYRTEDEFQTLLERFPRLLAGEQIDRVKPRRWLLVAWDIGIADGEDSSVP
jgi:hypothetical protein